MASEGLTPITFDIREERHCTLCEQPFLVPMRVGRSACGRKRRLCDECIHVMLIDSNHRRNKK